MTQIQLHYDAFGANGTSGINDNLNILDFKSIDEALKFAFNNNIEGYTATCSAVHKYINLVVVDENEVTREYTLQTQEYDIKNQEWKDVEVYEFDVDSPDQQY